MKLLSLLICFSFITGCATQTSQDGTLYSRSAAPMSEYNQPLASTKASTIAGKMIAY